MKSIEDLKQEMEVIRHDLPNEVDHLVQQAKTLTDWRAFLRNHPWVCAATALALGYLIIPPRRKVVRLDAETFAKWADENRVRWKPQNPPHRGSEWGRRLLEMGTKATAGVALNILAKKSKEFFK